MTTLLILLPLVGGIAAAIGAAAKLPFRRVGAISLLFSLAAFGVAIYFTAAFNADQQGLRWVTDTAWIPGLGVHFKVGIDGLNLFLLLLTSGLWLMATAASIWHKRFSNAVDNFSEGRAGLYFAMLALGETAVLGAFCAQDLILFVAFFDLMLVPFYLLIGIFGGPQRIRATTKFVIYTLVGSLLMLAGAIATGVLSASDGGALSFAFSDLVARPLGSGPQEWIFLFFAAAFLVKMPAFPIHGWMPDAYQQAPLPVVALLSAVLSKVGAYGFLKIVLPLYPDAAAHFQELILTIAVVSILYGSMMAFTRTETRLIVGYSSLAQLGFITAGIFALTPDGGQGAVLQMVNHGLVVGALFLIIGLLAARTGSEDITKMGGVAFRGPVLAGLFLVVTVATLAIPGSANFVGELLILLAVFKAKIVFAIVASVGVALAAVYMVRFFQRTMHGRVGEGVDSRDISGRDALLLVPLVAVIVALAIYPQFVLKRTDVSVTASESTHQVVAQR